MIRSYKTRVLQNRQTDRQTDRLASREIDGHRYRDRQAERLTGRWERGKCLRGAKREAPRKREVRNRWAGRQKDRRF